MSERKRAVGILALSSKSLPIIIGVAVLVTNVLQPAAHTKVFPEYGFTDEIV